ncbi:MAG: NUDIX domain-containing protein [Clostridiales Family XIII bacterium]|jgi:8-oxo-dGTP pyrophosphatase MutT (NUDIX family)|nr:NUDIX domain-containing protein [Clostridiales Family XIII bacterium]
MFKETIYRKDKKSLDLKSPNIIFRNAVRAVIIKENKILMAHLEKTNEYKFPGGGKEENETRDAAIGREVLEEVGYEVERIKEKIGKIREYDTAEEGGDHIFKMVSEYYLVEVNKMPQKQKLEDYEKELLFKPCWIEIETAYETNMERIKNKDETTPGIRRETKVLEIIKEIYK